MQGEGVQGDERELRLVASAEGRKLGVIEPGRVLVLGLPELLPIAEIGLEGGHDDNDVAFVGERLVVLSRAGAQPRLHVVDPAGPTKVAEVPLRAPLRIAAIAGDHVLAMGGGSTVIIDVAKPEPVAVPLLIRGVPSAAGSMGRAGFVIASSGMLEEWDAARRTPLRRLRLGRPLELAFVGGHGDRMWMISRHAPQHVEIVGLAKHSSRSVELVAAPDRVVANARGDLLVAICGETRSTYIVDLARQLPALRIDRGPMADVAWLGPYTLVLQPLGQPLELLSIPSPAEYARSAPDPDAPAPAASAPRAPAAPEVPTPAAPAPRARLRDEVDEPEGEPPPTHWTRDEISQRLAVWRKRVSTHDAPGGEATSDGGAAPPPAPPPRERSRAEVARSLPRHGALQPPHPGGWRAELASWARSICARSYRAAPTLDREILDELVVRLELDERLRDAVALLYGAYLNGLTGVAPIDVAAVIGWTWAEATGDGRLAQSGLLHWHRGRVALVPEALAALDGRPPRTGTIVGVPGAAVTAGAIVAPRTIDVLQLGAWAAPVVGALLVPNHLGDDAPHRFMLEARIRGLVPLVPWTRFCQALKVPPRPAAVLVEHAAAAAGLDLPVVATWSAPSQAPD